jgi:hypothetical protein
MPYPNHLANDADGGDELMGSSAQRLKLSAGISEIGRLVQPNFIAHQNLVGANNERMSMVFRYLPSLSLRKGKRTVGSSLPIGSEDPFDRFFVHQRRLDPHLEAGSSEQLLPNRARRGENQGFIHRRHAVAPTIS